MISELHAVFAKDEDFDERLFRRQIAVMKGQVYNLVQVLRSGLYVDGHDRHARHHVGVSPRSHSTGGRSSNATPTASLLPEDSQGTPLDLLRQPPCLVWEDEDVRDLVGGEFGQDVIGRDGMLGTIIGMETVSAPASPKLAFEAPPPASPMTEPLRPDPTQDSVHPPSSSTSGSPTLGPKHGGVSEGSEAIGGFLTAPSAIRYTGTVSASGSPRRRARDLGHNLDAFRGRVITFVKSQPWFSNW